MTGPHTTGGASDVGKSGVIPSLPTPDRKNHPEFDLPCDTVLSPPDVDPIWVQNAWWKRVRQWSDKGHNVLMVGMAGSGKTTGGQQLAAVSKLPFIRCSLDNSRDLRELFGRMAVIVEGGASRTVFVESAFLNICQREAGAVVLLDEVNFIDPQRAALLHELLDNRQVQVKEARGGMGKLLNIPKTVKFLLACNPPTAAFGGTVKMNGALVDRGAVVVVPALGAKTLKAILKNWGVEKERADLLVNMFVQADTLVRKQHLRVQVSVRSLRRVVDGLEMGLTPTQAVEEGLINAAVAMGDGVAKDALSGLVRMVLPDSAAFEMNKED